MPTELELIHQAKNELDTFTVRGVQAAAAILRMANILNQLEDACRERMHSMSASEDDLR